MKASKLDRLSRVLRMDVSSLASPFIGCISSMNRYSGVYVLEFDGGYFYIGKSVNLLSRLEWHLQRNAREVTSSGGCGAKYQSVTDKHLIERVYILEHQSSMFDGVLSSRESMWIGIFHKVLGGRKLVNTAFNGSRAYKPMKISDEERALRAVRMSKTIRDAHKDPLYKAKMKQIARENYANVHPEVRANAKATSSLKLKANFSANPHRREFMAAKVRRQWEDPEFRRINSDRIKKRMAEHSSGRRPLKRAFRTYTVYVLPLKKKFLVDTPEACSLLSLSSSSDKGPERKLALLLRADFRVIRNDPTPYDISEGHRELARLNLRDLKSEPFLQYIRKFRDEVGSYRTTPSLVRNEESGKLFRLLSSGINSLRRTGYTPVKTYTSLFQFWKDRALYPCLGHAKNLPKI